MSHLNQSGIMVRCIHKYETKLDTSTVHIQVKQTFYIYIHSNTSGNCNY